MSCFHVLRFHQDFEKRRLPLEMTGRYTLAYFKALGVTLNTNLNSSFSMKLMKCSSSKAFQQIQLLQCWAAYWDQIYKELTFSSMHLGIWMRRHSLHLMARGSRPHYKWLIFFFKWLLWHCAVSQSSDIYAVIILCFFFLLKLQTAYYSCSRLNHKCSL